MVNHMAHPGTVLGLERVAHLAQTLVALHKLIEDLVVDHRFNRLSAILYDLVVN